MEALSIGCRNKHWSLIILSNFDFINWLSLNMPGCCGAGCSGLKSSLYHNCILRDNQSMLSKFDKMISDQCLFLQPILSTSILNYFFEFQTWITNRYLYVKMLRNHPVFYKLLFYDCLVSENWLDNFDLAIISEHLWPKLFQDEKYFS